MKMKMNLNLISLLTISNTIIIRITAEKQTQTQTQTQTQNRFALDSETQSTTLIDLLSASTEHSRLLHLIQITRLVPVINALPKATLFAPTNSALEETLKAQQDTTTNTNQQQQQDNVQLQLRQTLLYHLLNFTLPLNQTIPKHTPEPLDTLLFPKPTHLLNINNDHNDDDHLLLGHQPQKLRIISRDQVSYIGVDARGQGGIALPGSEQIQQATNGILVPIQSILTPPPSLKKLIQSTPALSTYASILPEQLLDQLDLLPHLTIFAPHNPAWDHLSPIELSYLKSNFSTNDSIKLFRQAATDNVLAPEGIGYSHLLRHELQNHEHTSLALLSLDGNHLSVTLNPLSNQLAINGTEMVEQDILASNGVLHIVPNLLISDGDNNPLQLTPEKYLLGLNCTKFVALFREVNLSTKYLGNLTGEKSYTILAVRDDVLRSAAASSSSSFNPRINSVRSSVHRLSTTNDTESLRKSLSYHVIEGHYLIDDLKDGMLLRTELGFDGQSGAKQRMYVSVSRSSSGGGSQGYFSRDSPDSSPIIGFGGANVVGGDPIQVGKTVIYILSQIVEPPSDLVQVALSDIRFSTGVASLFSAKLDHLLKAVPELTYLMPTNKAFAKLGLIMDYLLLEKSRPDLVQVLKYHAVTEVIYLNELKMGTSQRYPTLEGTELYITNLASHNVTLHGPTVGGVALNGETQDSNVINRRDVLIENGSMQFIDQVELPAGVNIGLRQLMMGAKATTMLELIQASNLSWILDSGLPPSPPQDGDDGGGDQQQQQPPSLKKKKQKKGGGEASEINLARGYTILCPSDAAFTKVNLTFYLEDRERLEGLVRQHIIPLDPVGEGGDFSLELRGDRAGAFEPLVLEDGAVYSTLLSTSQGGSSRYGEVSFRENSAAASARDPGPDHGDDNLFKKRWLVGIKGARGSAGSHDSARVLNYGRASPRIIGANNAAFSFSPAAAAAAAAAGASSLDNSLSVPGGILLLDMVLLPYAPTFWNRIGKTILATILLVSLVAALALAGWKGWKVYQNKNRTNTAVVVGYHVVEPMEE